MSRDRIAKAYAELPTEAQRTVLRLTELFAQLEQSVTATKAYGPLDGWTSDELQAELNKRKETEHDDTDAAAAPSPA